MHLDIALLRTLVAVVETGGFTRAADWLNMTQSAVSVQIRRLEEQTGRRLLDRSSRHVALTPDGELLMSYARRMLALQGELEDRLGQRDLEGMVRVGVHDYAASTWLPPVLRRVHRRHPNVRLEVRTGLAMHIRQAFLAHELDLALHSPAPDMMGGIPLWREPRVWVAAEDFDMPPEDEALPLALHPAGCLMRHAAAQELDRVGRPWRMVLTAYSASSIIAAAMAGLAISVLPVRNVPAGLNILGPESGLPRVPDLQFSLYQREDAHSPAVQLFADDLIGAANEASLAA